MKNIIVIILLCLGISAMAQPENPVTKTIEGKKFYVHTVQSGNTLYGIHKLYNTDLDKIIAANPGLNNNLTIGQQILIPISLDSQDHYQSHKVEAGETLYGISRKYKCSVDDLKNLNPGIVEGISIGQVIKVPKNQSGEVIQSDPILDEKPKDNYQISLTDSIVKHEVLAHETLYAISKRYMVNADTIRAWNDLRGNKLKKGDILNIPVKKVNYEVLNKEVKPISGDLIILDSNSVFKNTYKIALMLPFMFEKNDIEMSKTLKLGQSREMYPTTKIAFEFYQGFMVAVDSLKKAGLNAEIFVYDTKKDTAVLGRIMSGDEFNDMDLVVGPLYPNTTSYAASKCKEKRIKLVIPFKISAKVLHENPFVFKCVTSNMTQIDGTVDYLVEHMADKNIIILKPYLEKDKALYERARSRFNEKIAQIPSYNNKIVEMSWGSSSGRDLNSLMKKDTANLVIVPSSDVKFVTGSMNRLNKVLNLNPYAKGMRVVVFGFEDWNKFDDIDILHRERLNQHFSTYRFVDYNQQELIPFLENFRKKTSVDPSIYSAQGFDVGYYFSSALMLFGTGFETGMSAHQIQLLQNQFNFERVSVGSGFENKHVELIQYKDFELKPVMKSGHD